MELLHKAEPRFCKDGFAKQKSSMYSTPHVISGEEESPRSKTKAWSFLKIRQHPASSTETICRNTRLLIEHTCDTISKIFEKTKTLKYKCTWLHRQTMYRLYLLTRVLLIYDLLTMLEPNAITIDPLELIKVRGNLFFTNFVVPDG